MIVGYQCLTCKATKVRFDDRQPGSCVRCGSGPAWQRETARAQDNQPPQQLIQESNGNA